MIKQFHAGLLAEYEDAERLTAAVVRVRAHGYRAVTTYTPFPVPHMDKALGLSRTKLPLVVLIAGLSGAVFAYWLQWYTAARSYPLDLGGRPAHAAPAFIPITFETTILFASCIGFLALWMMLNMPRLWEPVAAIEGFERSTVDRYWIGVAREDPRFDAATLERLLAADAPLRIVRLVEEGAAA